MRQRESAEFVHKKYIILTLQKPFAPDSSRS